MLDIKFIRENKEAVQKNCQNRNVKCDVGALLLLDDKRKNALQFVEELQTEKNKLNDLIQTTDDDERKKLIEQGKATNNKTDEAKKELEGILAEYNELLMQVPNMTHPDVKVSDDEDDNPVLEVVKEPQKFDFELLDHVQLAETLDLIDFDRGAKVTGAKFYYSKNELALLQIAVEMYAFEKIIKHGFTPMITPDLAKTDIIERLGYNPRGKSTQVYNLENSDLSLIGTSEITMGGYHMDETFSEEELPKKYVAFSHCFRTEAGTYSKFSKGIFRVHQFAKVEMFQYVLPEKSEEAHREILEIEKEIFSGLGIPFRVIDHCTADLGTPSYRTFDLEAWMPGKPNKNGGSGDWAEITSASNCTDYQSRGLNIKYKNKEGKREFVHMLNGTGISLARASIVIIENCQQADGSVKIPEVLKKYMPGSLEIIKKK